MVSQTELQSDSGIDDLPIQATRSTATTIKKGMSVIVLGNIKSETLYDQYHKPVFYCSKEQCMYRFDHTKKGKSVIRLGNINSETLYDLFHKPVFYCPIEKCIYRFDQK